MEPAPSVRSPERTQAVHAAGQHSCTTTPARSSMARCDTARRRPNGLAWPCVVARAAGCTSRVVLHRQAHRAGRAVVALLSLPLAACAAGAWALARDPLPPLMVRVVVQQPLLSLFDGPRALDDQAMLTQGHALLRKRVRREALEKASLRQAVPRRNPPTLTSHHPTPPAMATQILDEISAKLPMFPLFEFCVWIYLDLRRPALQVALLSGIHRLSLRRGREACRCCLCWISGNANAVASAPEHAAGTLNQDGCIPGMARSETSSSNREARTSWTASSIL